MESTENKGGIGPALAVVVIVAVVAVAGIYFYKHMVKDLSYRDHGATVVVPERQYESTDQDEVNNTQDLSTSTDIESIAADLERELAANLDLSIVDDIDEELLNFDDLDDLDFNF